MHTNTQSGLLKGGRTVLVVLFLASTLLLIAGTGAYYMVFVKAPHDLARNVAGGIRNAFNLTPRVAIQQTIVIEQTTPVAEFATLSRDLFVDHSWSHTWMGSTKAIEIQATYTTKVGFDLGKQFLITIERNPLRVIAQLPPPKILSLELKTYRVVRDENGWWNRISPADREQVMYEMQSTARRRAEESGVLREAHAGAEARIRDIVERNGAPVLFERPGHGE